jgi:hypothetical protein
VTNVAHLPQEKFQRRFSALNGLELRLHTSSFLQAPTYSRPGRGHLPDLNRLAAEIAAVQSEGIEGVEEGLVLAGASSELEA